MGLFNEAVESGETMLTPLPFPNPPLPDPDDFPPEPFPPEPGPLPPNPDPFPPEPEPFPVGGGQDQSDGRPMPMPADKGESLNGDSLSALSNQQESDEITNPIDSNSINNQDSEALNDDPIRPMLGPDLTEQESNSKEALDDSISLGSSQLENSEGSSSNDGILPASDGTENPVEDILA